MPKFVLGVLAAACLEAGYYRHCEICAAYSRIVQAGQQTSMLYAPKDTHACYMRPKVQMHAICNLRHIHEIGGCKTLTFLRRSGLCLSKFGWTAYRHLCSSFRPPNLSLRNSLYCVKACLMCMLPPTFCFCSDTLHPVGRS